MLTMLVTVFMTNCHVSLQWKTGPLMSQARVIAQIAINAALDPVALAVLCAIAANHSVCFIVCSITIVDAISRVVHAKRTPDPECHKGARIPWQATWQPQRPQNSTGRGRPPGRCHLRRPQMLIHF